MAQCSGTTKFGLRCKNSGPHNGRCHHHREQGHGSGAPRSSPQVEDEHGDDDQDPLKALLARKKALCPSSSKEKKKTKKPMATTTTTTTMGEMMMPTPPHTPVLQTNPAPLLTPLGSDSASGGLPWPAKTPEPNLIDFNGSQPPAIPGNKPTVAGAGGGTLQLQQANVKPAGQAIQYIIAQLEDVYATHRMQLSTGADDASRIRADIEKRVVVQALQQFAKVLALESEKNSEDDDDIL
ncbi:uncharacterized protein IWZ02DRAFT_495140 [Phyllosticta citriasiana]|uniref:uncharacterized protein n=1 Tax=Phyllosticta citriasiana TaxID=595635 RepID=UPI0030FD8065